MAVVERGEHGGAVALGGVRWKRMGDTNRLLREALGKALEGGLSQLTRGVCV